MAEDQAQGQPQPPRLGAACDECRRRKLRCDRRKPRCGICEASRVPCVVPVERPTRGPKRGYLKSLQTKIADLETALHQQVEQRRALPNPPAYENNQGGTDNGNIRFDMRTIDDFGIKDATYQNLNGNLLQWNLENAIPTATQVDDMASLSAMDLQDDWLSQPGPFGSGPQHALPHMSHFESDGSTCVGGTTLNSAAMSVGSCPQTPASALTCETSREAGPISNEVLLSSLQQSDLDQLYIDRIQTFIPIENQGLRENLSSISTVSDSGATSAAHTALRYAMWTLAASASPTYSTLRGSLHDRARHAIGKLDDAVFSSPRDRVFETEAIQAWLLVAVHELMTVDFRQAWVSAGRALRLIQLDSAWAVDEEPYGIPPPSPDQPSLNDWNEAEQRRKTYWFAYCLDRFMSLQTGSSPTFGEDMPVRLPCPESAFQYDRQPAPMGFHATTFLPVSQGASSGGNNSPRTPLVECIAVATVTGQVISHRRQATFAQVLDSPGATGCASGETSTANAGDTSSTTTAFGLREAFWERHIKLDALVTKHTREFSGRYPPSARARDPMLIFLTMMWHVIVIHLCRTVEGLAPEFGGGLDCTEPSPCANSSVKVESAVHEIMGLINSLSNLNKWKVHPLITIPLRQCSKLLEPWPKLMKAFNEKLTKATQHTYIPGLSPRGNTA